MKRNAALAINTLFLALLFINSIGCEEASTAKNNPTPPPPAEYTVTFDSNQGTLAGAATVKVETGKTVAQPQNPTREGFSFTAWQTADGTAFDFATIITADITLIANWNANAGTTTYTVTFDPNGGMLAGNATVEVAEGANLVQPQNPTREGFTFTEWQRADGTAFDFTTETITANITLISNWNANAGTITYMVTFDPNQGMLAGNPTVEVAEGANLVQPQNPTRAGFSFIEWQNPDGTAFGFTTETITADITLNANWRSAGTVTMVALMANMMDDGYTVNFTYTNDAGTATGGTPEITWFISDNPDGSDSTQVAMGMEVAYTPTGVNRYKHLAATVRVRATEGGYTAAVISTPVFTGFSKQAAGAANGFPVRFGHTSVVFNNSMWVIGGFDRNRLNDVWSSTDGSTWTQETADAGFPARSNPTSVVFMDSIRIIGGFGNNRLNDVWSSADGITWIATRATGDANGFPARDAHTSVVFMDSIRVIGGIGSQFNNLNDVWSSADGSTWTQATADAGFPARARHTSVVFDNKIYVIGGATTALVNNDVWSSADGSTWTEATADAGFPDRNRHTSVVFDNRMWVIGGFTTARVNDVWSSTDGSTWTQATANAGFAGRQDHTSVVFDNKMWVIGGNDGNNRLNDVWY